MIDDIRNGTTTVSLYTQNLYNQLESKSIAERGNIKQRLFSPKPPDFCMITHARSEFSFFFFFFEENEMITWVY